jgi:hypothetical protein
MASILVRGTSNSSNRADRVAIAIATCAALRFNKKVLILPLTTSYNPLDVLIGQKTKETMVKARGYVFDDSGIDALLRRIEQGAIDATGFAGVCANIAKEGNLFDIASNSKRQDLAEYIPTIEVQLTKILKHANKVYDLVIVLADAKDKEALKVLEKITDKELTVIAQGPKMDFEAAAETLYAINNYDDTSVYNYKAMKKIYGISGDTKMYPFPYNIRFKDACRQENAIEFLASNVNEDQLDDNYVFLETLKNLTSAALGIERAVIEERKFTSKERPSKRK